VTKWKVFDNPAEVSSLEGLYIREDAQRKRAGYKGAAGGGGGGDSDGVIVTDVAPNPGQPLGGELVLITGTGFAAGASVYFGATQSNQVTVLGPTSIRALTPPGSDTVDVRVVNLDASQGTLDNGYSYNAGLIWLVEIHDAQDSDLTTVTVDGPSDDVLNGDVLVAVVQGKTTGDITLNQFACTGWIFRGRKDIDTDADTIADFSVQIFTKTATASEPASYVWTLGLVGVHQITYLALRNVFTVTPIDAFAFGATQVGTQTLSPPGVTLNFSDALVLGVMASPSSLSGFGIEPSYLPHLNSDGNIALGNNETPWIAADRMSSTGPTGAASATFTNVVTGFGLTIAIRKA